MTIARSDLETELAAALSRHIGYTTGAYEVYRIASIAKNFRNKPSLYQYELVQFLIDRSRRRQRSIDKGYAAEIVNYAVALGILDKVADGPTPGTRRYSLTPVGFTIKSALDREDGFLKFILIGLVLESDCDMYGLLLDILHEKRVSGAELHQEFIMRFADLRDKRHAWLRDAFPNQVLHDRIEQKMPWRAHQQRSRTSSLAFGRHHVTPRLGWAKWFGHIGSLGSPPDKADSSPLTHRGLDLLEALREEANEYTWLGPEEGTQEALGIPEMVRRGGPYAPSWNLLRPTRFRHSKAAIDRIADDVVEFMDWSYKELKLVYANQASIASVMPYLHFTESELGYAVKSNTVFDRIFQKRSSFSYLSSRKHKYGYFRRAAP